MTNESAKDRARERIAKLKDEVELVYPGVVDDERRASTALCWAQEMADMLRVEVLEILARRGAA